MMGKGKSTKRKHIFISHHHKDDQEVDKLTTLLKGKGYDVRNSSIRAKPANQERLKNGMVRDEVIRRLLRIKISWAGAVIVLVGKETHSRPWVNWEIEQAHKQGKRIVGVWAYGERQAELPEALEKYGDSVVGWRADRILDAINGKTDGWEDRDGNPRGERSIPRIECQ